MSTSTSPIEASLKVAAAVRADVTALLGRRGAVVLEAVAGAGKSTFISETIGLLAAEDVTIAVAAPTNDQVFVLVGAIARAHPTLTVTYIPANAITLPPTHRADNVVEARPARAAQGAQVIVGTLDKLGDAYQRGHLGKTDCLIVDESYQANSGHYYGAAELADVHLLVGDSGQIDPFSTSPEALRYKGLDEDPVRTAVEVLLASHPNTPVHRFPITRRLDARAIGAMRAFYPPDHLFDAAIAAGEREMRFMSSLARDPRTRALDHALNLASEHGWAHLELPSSAVVSSDPQAVTLIADLIARLNDRAPEVHCERIPDLARLDIARVAVGVSHNDQMRAVRRALAERGLGRVIVSTANKLQGLEFDLAICWHPLAGLTDVDSFHLEAGRLCVLATRHRHACLVVGRQSDRLLLEGGVPPTPPAWLGREEEPLLEGWEAHDSFFAALDTVRVPVAV